MTPDEMRAEAKRLVQDPSQLGLAEKLWLHSMLIDSKLSDKVELLASSASNWGPDGSRIRSLLDVEWNYDPAASGARRRAFVWISQGAPPRLFVLGAYETGSWWVEEHLRTLSGSNESQSNLGAWWKHEPPLYFGKLVRAQVCALRSLLAVVPLPNEDF